MATAAHMVTAATIAGTMVITIMALIAAIGGRVSDMNAAASAKHAAIITMRNGVAIETGTVPTDLGTRLSGRMELPSARIVRTIN